MHQTLRHLLVTALITLPLSAQKPNEPTPPKQPTPAPAPAPKPAPTPAAKPAPTPAPKPKPAPVPRVQTKAIHPPILPSDYSYAYWDKSWRKLESENFQDLLCFETDHFGLKLNIDNLTRPHFGLLSQRSNHLNTLATGSQRLNALPQGELKLEVEHSGSIYRLVSCLAAEKTDTHRLASVRMWESGTIAQHYDIQNLIFKNDQGKILNGNSSLDLVVWPNSVTLNGQITPDHLYAQGPITGLNGDGLCLVNSPYSIAQSKLPSSPAFTVECWINQPTSLSGNNEGWLLCNKKHENDDGHFGLSIGHLRPSASLNIGGGGKGRVIIRGKNAIVHDKWIQLALTYDTKTLRLFVNGSEQASQEVNLPRNAGEDLITLGNRGDAKKGATNALYDQIRLWNRALNVNEIRQLHKQPQKPPIKNGLTLDHSFGNQYQAPNWKDATLRLSLKNGTQNWQTEKKIPGVWNIGEEKKITLNGQFNNTPVKNPNLTVSLTTPDKKTVPLNYTPELNSYTTSIQNINKQIKKGYTDIRTYDDITINITNKGTTPTRVPVHFHYKNPPQITGLSPILCHPDGTPTGIPVQLSKNWHHHTMGSYFRPYMIIPAQPGQTTYKLRIAYGFYGQLPAASHAQLSLVGYANNTRWDQLAIGCWGETICFDMDTACVPNVITDVRGLMLRDGKEGRKWSWTDCGWGGDWLKILQPLAPKTPKHKQSRLYLSGLKTAYHAHGPCLTDVRHHGHYGTNNDVALTAQIQTPRSDDYARTFQNFSYTFNKAQPADATTFFALGDRSHVITPRYALGDLNGLQAEIPTPADAKQDAKLLDRHLLNGNGPAWIAFPGANLASQRPNWGSGTRALIIRSYKATFNGKEFTRPSITILVNKDLGPDKKSLNLYLTPPKEITTIQPGDKVEFDSEWITLPRVVDDYYGPNETFASFLAKHPNSWKPVHREVLGNNLQVTATGAQVLKNYPLELKATSPQKPATQEVRFTINGGIGAVPVRIENLKSPIGYHLYQIVNGQPKKFHPAVHGNDYWQTDYNTTTQTYQITYNLPLDLLPQSTWLFTNKPQK